MNISDGINWYGWMNATSGYGIVNLEYATALDRLTGKVTIGWERRENILPEEYSKLTPAQRKLIDKPYRKSTVGIIKTTPQLFDRNTSDFRIGYTMVENTMIGKRWVEMCNRMSAIFVPSEFLVDVFKSCGVKPPVVAVKQGINTERFPYISRLSNNAKRGKPFIFGTVGYQDERKNWEDLVRAFTSEFNNREPVELWIKNSNPYFGHRTFNDPRIKIINRMYSFEEIKRLYALFDCFVFPSHGEGSGLPPREAMATGLPVILTDWSGLSEVADPEYAYPLTPVAIDFPDIRGEEQPGFMARIDVQELMYWMRYVYEHQSEAKQKGKKAAEYVHREWNWDACARDLLRKLEGL